MRVALDTNVLAYAEGVGDAARTHRARGLLRALPAGAIVLPAQVLGELFRVLTGKIRRDASQVGEAIQSWSDCYEVADSTWRGVTVADPFGRPNHPVLDSLLAGQP